MADDELRLRLQAALDLFEVGFEMQRSRLQRENPTATDDEILALLNAWMVARPAALSGDAIGRPGGLVA
jgi:hypothetical protein